MTIAAPEHVCISQGVLELERRRVTRDDLALVVELACRVHLPEGRRMLGARLRVCFRVDDAEVGNPAGMECQRLEADLECMVG